MDQNTTSTAGEALTPTHAPADALAVPPGGFALNFDEGRFLFQRPATPEIQRYMRKVGEDMTAASVKFMTALVIPEQRAEWVALTSDTNRPGYPVQGANFILRQLGFVGSDLEVPEADLAGITVPPGGFALAFDEDVVVVFKRPTPRSIQTYMRKVADDMVKASHNFMLECVTDADKDRWLTLIRTDGKPGYPVQGANFILKALGFVGSDLSD